MNVDKEIERLREAAAFGNLTEEQIAALPDAPASDQPPKIVYSSRIPAEYSPEITAAAAEADVTPSRMIAILVGEALQARRLHASQRVTVDLATLHRLVDQIAEAA